LCQKTLIYLENVCATTPSWILFSQKLKLYFVL
jgi:hypothetical protein